MTPSDATALPPVAITIDVEDWFHVCGIGVPQPVARNMWRTKANIIKILALLDSYQCKATFFMLGSVAESEPDIAPMIAAKGHEIASHGYSHTLLTDMDQNAFRDELMRTEQILTKQIGVRPIGFRAPQWSVPYNSTWMDEILIECGYHYDSSRNPLPFVGDSSLPLHPYTITTSRGTLLELPPMVTPTIFGNLPTGGGWGFRFFPIKLIEATVRKYHRAKAPAVLYIHPRELDPDGPRLKLPPLKSFVSYGSRKDAVPQLSMLLEQFRCSTLSEIAASWPRTY